MAGPRGWDRQAAPPPPPFFWPTGGIAREPEDPPSLPPPPLPHRPESRRGGPPPPPAPTPAGEPQARPSAPQGRGGAPSHRRNGDTVRAAAAGPAPTNPHRRAGATRTTEHEGGRAPHDPPVTTAHSEGKEGGVCRSAGAPRGAVHGPPLTPPRPGAARQPRPHARAGGEGQKGVPQAAARNESGEAAARHPPRGKGNGPPHPRGGPECDPPPRSGRRPTRGPRRTNGPTPAHRDAAQIVPGEAG